MISSVKINEGDKSLSVSLAIDNIPATQFFNNQLLSQVQENCGGNIIDWLQRCHKCHEVVVTFQPNDSNYIELAEHLASGALTYNLEQARTICNWIHDNIRQPIDDVDWATVFLEIIDHAE